MSWLQLVHPVSTAGHRQQFVSVLGKTSNAMTLGTDLEPSALAILVWLEVACNSIYAVRSLLEMLYSNSM